MYQSQIRYLSGFLMSICNYLGKETMSNTVSFGFNTCFFGGIAMGVRDRFLTSLLQNFMRSAFILLASWLFTSNAVLGASNIVSLSFPNGFVGYYGTANNDNPKAPENMR